MNNKKHILLPAVLALYVVVMAIIGYPRYQKSGNLASFWITVSVCLALAVLLYFVLKRRARNRENFRKEK